MKKKEESEKRERKKEVVWVAVATVTRQISTLILGVRKYENQKSCLWTRCSTKEYVVHNTVILKVGKSESRISFPCLLGTYQCSRIFYLLSRMKKCTRSFVERKGTALTQTQTKTPKQWRIQIMMKTEYCTVNDDLVLVRNLRFVYPFLLSELVVEWHGEMTTALNNTATNDDEKRMIPTMLWHIILWFQVETKELRCGIWEEIYFSGGERP
jgi:hypothetical protein